MYVRGYLQGSENGRVVTIDRNARQLGPRTTRTETSRPVSEDKSAGMLRQLGPYVKTTRTVLLFYNIVQYLYVYNYSFI